MYEYKIVLKFVKAKTKRVIYRSKPRCLCIEKINVNNR